MPIDERYRTRRTDPGFTTYAAPDDRLQRPRRPAPRQTTASPLILVVLVVVSVAVALGAIALLRPAAPGSDTDPTPAGSMGESATAGKPSTAGGAATPTTVRSGTATMQPGAQRALTKAQDAARAAGHTLTLTSGARTVEKQKELLAEALDKYGSRAEAERWVFPPDKSMHVLGFAMDVGDGPAADWLHANGSRFGLCKTLDWEWWHFEWRESWERSGSCPRPALTPEDAPGL